MNKDMAVFDANALKKKVAEEAQARFGSLIPPNQFEAMIDAAIKEFFETPVQWSVTVNEQPRHQSIYSNKLASPISPFKAIVWGFLHKEAINVVEAYFKNKENAATKFLIDSLENNKNLSDEMDVRTAQLAAIASGFQMSLMTKGALHALSMSILDHANKTGNWDLQQSMNNFLAKVNSM